MSRNVTLYAIPLFFLSACASTTSQSGTPEPAAIRQEMAHKNHKKADYYEGPNIASGNGNALNIRAWNVNDPDLIKFQIYVCDHYFGGWRLYNNAFDSKGVGLDSVVISRASRGCSSVGCIQFEVLGINVSKEYLESNAQNGVNFKIVGSAGEAEFYIPGEYIKSFLKDVKLTSKNAVEVLQKSGH